LKKFYELASQFGLAFTLRDELAGLYNQFGIDLVRYNDNDQWSLPMPALFVLDQRTVPTDRLWFASDETSISFTPSDFAVYI